MRSSALVQLRRALVSVCCITAVGLLSGVAASQGESACTGEPMTCNEDKTACCNWWVADVTLDGKKTGSLLEQSYEKMQQAIESHRKTDKSLCAYFHDHSDCAEEVGTPHCSGAIAGATRNLLAASTEPIKQSISKGESKLVELAQQTAAFRTLSEAMEAQSDTKISLGDAAMASASNRVRTGGLVQANKALKGASAVQSSIDNGSSATSAVTGEVLSRIRSAVIGAHTALDEYSKNLGGAIQRAKGLRETLTECARTHNPFLDLDQANSGAGLPRPWQVNINGGYGFPVTYEFSSPTDQQQQSVAQQEGRRSLTGLLSHAPTVPNIVTLHLDAATNVVSHRTSGSGRLVIGSKGFIGSAPNLGAGDYPLLFAGEANGAIAFGEAHVTRTRDGDGERITIEGSANGNQETIELFACTGGRELRGGHCVCPGTRQWTGSSCGCPQGEHEESGQCKSCPQMTSWNGQSCACPGNATWDGRQCTCPAGEHLEVAGCRSCPGGSSWNGNQCQCPTGMTWNGQSCAQPGVAPITILGQCSQYQSFDPRLPEAIQSCAGEGGTCVVIDATHAESLPHDWSHTLARMVGKRWCGSATARGLDNNTKSPQCCRP